MNGDERNMDYIFFVRNVVEVYQGELKQAKILLEKCALEYTSAMIAHEEAVKLYEKRIAEIRRNCVHHGLSDAEIEALTKWRED